jgi:hypothetical protein
VAASIGLPAPIERVRTRGVEVSPHRIHFILELVEPVSMVFG